MTPINFGGANIIIAKDQPPYLPLPAHFTRDEMGTAITCWELNEVFEVTPVVPHPELFERCTHGIPSGMVCDECDKVVGERVETGRPEKWEPEAQPLPRQSNGDVVFLESADCNGETNLTHCGWTGPGWYFWDETDANLYGPLATEKEALRALADYAKHLNS